MKEDVLCTRTHEYLFECEDCYKVGITDYVIKQLGDIVFVELPEIGTKFNKNEVFATIESVKTASELFMPISGKVISINDEIAENPELLNDEAYDDNWLIKIESVAEQIELVDLLDYSDYKDAVE